MIRSKSFHVSSIEDLEIELRNIQINEFQPTLAILFGSVKCDLEKIPNLFNQFDIDIIGCSSSGEIYDEEVFENGMSVLLMDINRDYYRINVTDCVDNDFLKTGNSIGKLGVSFCDSPSFLMFINMMSDAENLIAGISEVVPNQPNIFGGMAGDDFQMIRTYTFTHRGIFDDAIVSLVFDENKVEMKGLALCGWEPIGTLNTVTEAEGSTIYSINDKPALEVFENYFGSFYENKYEEETVALGVAQYPLQIIRGESTLMRAALKVNEEDKSIMMAGPVQKGDVFKFSVAPGFEIIEETISGFQEYQKEQREADAIILVSCKARHLSLGPMVESEIKGIQNIWNKPMIGFFSYGEIGVSQAGDCLFYNETCSLVLIKEK